MEDNMAQKIEELQRKLDKSKKSAKKFRSILGALGLKYEEPENAQAALRYGHVALMMDQDIDGFHIKGLLLYFFRKCFPLLLQKPSFLQDLTTPLMTATHLTAHTINIFKSNNEFNDFWKSGNDVKEWDIKYFKGLASHDPPSTIEYFRCIKKHLRNFYWEGKGDENFMMLAFSQAEAMSHSRKLWIRRHKKGMIPDFSNNVISYGHFFQKEYILYFVGVVERSIPCMVDGLKPSQRKVLFVLLEKVRPNISLAVNSISGRVLETCAYHHGQASLDNVIAQMGEDFVGSKNINLIIHGGAGPTSQKGARPGKRYLKAKVSPITNFLFPIEDLHLLDYNQSDGLFVEPKRYVPIIPLALVNGCSGVACGFKCEVPPYNPEDLVRNIRRLMNNGEVQEMTPWYRGFKGTVTRMSNSVHYVEGAASLHGSTLEITVLPVGESQDEYAKKVLLKLLKAKKIVEYTNTKTGFQVKLNDANLTNIQVKEMFMLSKKKTSQFNLLNAEGDVVSYESVEEILGHFFVERLELYKKRKAAKIADLASNIAKTEVQIAELADLQRAEQNVIEFQWWEADLVRFEKQLEESI